MSILYHGQILYRSQHKLIIKILYNHPIII